MTDIIDKLQEYLEMRERHLRDVNNFPIAFAFNEKQLNEALEKLSVKSIDECCTVHNCGVIIRKRDFKAYKDMAINHEKELNEAMKDPEFAKSAFRYEMDNHEYAINWDGDSDVLSCFGWTPYNFGKKASVEVQNAYLFARNEHIEHFRNLGVI